MMTEPTLVWIINGLLILVSAVGGWFMRQLWDAVKELKKDLQALQVKVAEEYVRHDRLQDAFKPILDSLNEIKETLKGKADKP